MIKNISNFLQRRKICIGKHVIYNKRLWTVLSIDNPQLGAKKQKHRHVGPIYLNLGREYIAKNGAKIVRTNRVTVANVKVFAK